MSFLNKLGGIFKGGAKKPSVEKKTFPKIQPKPQRPVVDMRALEDARSQAKELILQAKEDAFNIKQDALEKVNKLRLEAENLQREIINQKTEVEKKQVVIDEKQRLLTAQMKGVDKKLSELEEKKKLLIKKLEQVAQLTRDQAKKLLLTATEKKITEEIAVRIKEAEEKIKEESEQRAREILTDAMRFGATDYVAEFTVSTVSLRDDDMKGRVIGKEGRNIRAFEKATGVDVDLDEEGVIRLSSFDSVRREIARVSLEQLLRDGRIQPSRIEEVVVKNKEQIEKIMYQAGETLARKVNVFNLPSDIIKMLGRFKYRFSYGQNLITHTLEETKIAVSIAHEIGANVNVVRLGCLLHDIGKVITDKEGSHVELGVEFLKKFNIPSAVIDTVAQHHEDTAFSSVESIIVYIADAISGSRPGARYEDFEEYVKRIKDIEDLAGEFKGVRDTYALQAGREIRVIVEPEEISDAQAKKMAFDLKEKIEQKLTYPGTIKVTVIRELREIEVAK